MSKTWGFFFGGSGHDPESLCQISAYYKFFPGFNVFCRISTGLKVKGVTSQKSFVTPFKFNFSLKLLRFRKVTSRNLKIGKLPGTLATSNFQELFVIKFNSKPS